MDKSAIEKEYPFLSSLNQQQRAAVEHINGPSLIVAGAGSGKTTVLTAKVAYMIAQGIKPWNILALTFTNKAAREMRTRIELMINMNDARSVWMGTFHSIFSRILRQEAHVFGFNSNYTIYQPSDTNSLIKSIVKEMNLDDKAYKHSIIANRISMLKNMLITPVIYHKQHESLVQDTTNGIPKFSQIYTEYFKRCHDANAMDFDDLLLYTYILLQAYPEVRQKYADKFKYVLVDEFQDTNMAQAQIVHLIAGEHRNICVVGDDAQSIYSFRGARIDNILEFENMYENTHIFKLERNYRSTKNIVNAADSLIRKNSHQIRKNIFSDNEEGSPLIHNELTSDIEEGEMVCNTIQKLHKEKVPYSEIAVLYRTNGQSRIFEESLCKRGIPCIIYGSHSFYDQKEIRDVLAYLRLITNQNDEEALRRIINYPTRGIGNTTLTKLFTLAHEQHVPAWNIVQQPDLYNLDVTRGTKAKLIAFAAMINGFVNEIDSLNAYQIGQKVLTESGLMRQAQMTASNEGKEIIDNYSSLLSGMSQFVEYQRETGNTESLSLINYLSEISLLTDSDKDADDNGENVRLMTVHIAKGLEFDVVFVTGLEKDIFPSSMCYTQKEIEEERRLLFVAITRARKQCYLSNAKCRFRFGKSDVYDPSPFLNDIDRKYIYEESSYDKLSYKRCSEYIDFDVFDSRPTPPTKFSKSSTYPTPHSTYKAPQSTYKTSPTSTASKSMRRIGIRPSSEVTSSQIALSVNVSNGTIHQGSIIEHQTFGLGEVIKISNDNLGPKATIKFANQGEKTLLLKYAAAKIKVKN